MHTHTERKQKINVLLVAPRVGPASQRYTLKSLTTLITLISDRREREREVYRSLLQELDLSAVDAIVGLSNYIYTIGVIRILKLIRRANITKRRLIYM